MIKTLITHFYNEQYLLPWWLMHHVPLFDHGILLNRGSTDRSVEVIQKLAPHWEIRDSNVPQFDAIDIDREVMSIESQVTGWKMVLNTTEFLCVWDKAPFFSSLVTLGERIYSIRIITMVDVSSEGYTDPIYTIPLVRQRHHGIYPHQTLYNGRFIHSYSDGAYYAGRHESFHPYEVYLDAAFVLKFSFSPWTQSLIKRKLQIGPTLSDRARDCGLGIQHITTEDQLGQTYLGLSLLSEDLRKYPDYMKLQL